MILTVDTNSITYDFLQQMQESISLLPKIQIRSIIEIAIIAMFIYTILKWIQSSRGWILLRGIFVILCVVFLAYLFDFQVILWIMQQMATFALVAIIVIFQDELRAALEKLGKQKFFAKIMPNIKNNNITSDSACKEIARASFSMSKVKTGALIVIQQKESLERIESTGIAINGVVTSQLLINIFEKNTPLHDGAVLIEGDIVKAATCYLPLTSKELPKEYGTRHRAAVGMTENSDAIVVVVSEETGNVSLSIDGNISKVTDEEELVKFLTGINSKESKQEKDTFVQIMKGLNRGEKTKNQ